MRFSKLLLPSLSLVLLSSVWLPSAVCAQSPFALTNIGQPIDSHDARMAGRGGWGMAVYDSLNPGFKNVAALSSLRHVAIKFTAYGEKSKISNDLDSRSTHRTLVPEIRVGLPVIKGKLAFTAGIEVGRSFEFRTLTPKTWYAFEDTLTGNEQFIREGTLWQVPLGLSWKVMDGVSLGGTLGLVNGTIRESTNNFFIFPANINGVPLYLSNGKVQEDEFSGRRTTWSIHLGSNEGVAVGASWTPAHDLDVDRKVSMGGLAERSTSQWHMGLPESYQAGFQARISPRWRLGGDASVQKFSDFSGNDDWTADMVDEYTVGFGLEREIGFERHGGKGNLPLRLGVKYRRWGYLVNGSEVDEKTISLGTGFPFRQNMGMLDLALSYSMLGDLERNGMKSDVWRMTISVTGLEKWW